MGDPRAWDAIVKHLAEQVQAWMNSNMWDLAGSRAREAAIENALRKNGITPEVIDHGRSDTDRPYRWLLQELVNGCWEDGDPPSFYDNEDQAVADAEEWTASGYIACRVVALWHNDVEPTLYVKGLSVIPEPRAPSGDDG